MTDREKDALRFLANVAWETSNMVAATSASLGPAEALAFMPSFAGGGVWSAGDAQRHAL
jgi:hypothetical protein